MTLTQEVRRLAMCLSLAAVVPGVASAQLKTTGGPLTGPPVLNAPFSADATTTVSQNRADGSRIELSATARYYRDHSGRVRVEQTIKSPDGRNSAAGERVRITLWPDPSTEWSYALDPSLRTVAKGARFAAGLAVGGGDTFAMPLGGTRFLTFGRGHRLLGRIGLGTDAVQEEPLGIRRIGGVEVTGVRLTTTVPAGQWDNDRPMQIVDERWESTELKLVIYSRHTNPRTGSVEYQLTNIRRNEPPPDLFVIPADYTTDAVPEITEIFADPNRKEKGAPAWTTAVK